MKMEHNSRAASSFAVDVRVNEPREISFHAYLNNFAKVISVLKPLNWIPCGCIVNLITRNEMKTYLW